MVVTQSAFLSLKQLFACRCVYLPVFYYLIVYISFHCTASKLLYCCHHPSLFPVLLLITHSHTFKSSLAYPDHFLFRMRREGSGYARLFRVCVLVSQRATYSSPHSHLYNNNHQLYGMYFVHNNQDLCLHILYIAGKSHRYGDSIGPTAPPQRGINNNNRMIYISLAYTHASYITH